MLKALKAFWERHIIADTPYPEELSWLDIKDGLGR